MTPLQTIQLKQSEVRTKLSAELGKAEADRVEGELETLTKQAQTLELEYRAALLVDQETGIPDRVETPEGRELSELRSRVHFGKYVQAAMAGGGIIDGPELEYNQELNIERNYFPMDILARSLPDGGELETRAKRDGDAGASQGSWLDRVFAMSAAQRVGVTFRSVSPGVAAYPVTTAGGSGVQRGRDEAVGESTYTIAVTEMKPSRNAVHGIYSVEDDLRLPGLSDAIERDMRDAVMDAIDKAIFVGDSGANEAGADITGLNTAAITETTLTQANKIKGAETLQVFLAWVDGIYAGMIEDLNVVTAVGANTLWGGTIVNAAASNETIAQFLRASGMTWQTRGGIETNTANGNFGAFVGLNRGMDGSAIAAVWNAGQLIRDPYSSATSGQVQLTLNYLWNLAIPRAANFKRLKFVS